MAKQGQTTNASQDRREGRRKRQSRNLNREDWVRGLSPLISAATEAARTPVRR
jgi:hypothetical protein